MKAKALLAVSLLVAAHGCAVTGARAPGGDTTANLRELDAALTSSERTWAEAIDDPWTEPELARTYAEMQGLCRECASRRGGFETVEQKTLCDRVANPFEIYHNQLRMKVNRLEEQIEVKNVPEGAPEPNTAAHEYRRWPSKANLEKLKRIFDQVHRYYVGDPYTWTRYINKYAFQKSRSDHFREEFLARDAELRSLLADPAAPPRKVALARRRAGFAFDRLKEEYVTNDLPPAGEVNAFFLARTIDDYHRLADEERALAGAREAAGRRKEVVVFVHGLGETRAAWGKFPELLAREDTVNPALAGRYFKVYLFQYDTVEDSKSVEGFKKELAGFIRDVIRDEGVSRVHLVGHSFGAVLCLKYIGEQADDLLEKAAKTGQSRMEASIGSSSPGPDRVEGGNAQTVQSFISIAGSLSGSEIANIAGDRFIPRERLFRKTLPLFRSGVPGYGDIQVRENQIGSEVNLASFRRLDTECPLSPQDRLRFLPPADKALAEKSLPALRGASIPTLCIVADPVKVQSLCSRHGLLKMGKVGRLFRVDGFTHVVSSFQRDEDDGLVKSYSANLNHGWLTEAGEDIGYRHAGVRYTEYAHFSVCKIDSRLYSAYRYVVSFLDGELLPQMEPDRYRIELFGTLLRVFPDIGDPAKHPGAFFMPEERVVYLKDRKLMLPALRVQPVAAGRGDGGPASENVSLRRPAWNRMTGVCFHEGRVKDLSRPARVVYRVSADGYEDALVTVPVRAGEMTYAVNVSLKRKETHP